MSIRKLTLLTAVAAVGLMGLATTSASASTALRTDPGGSLLTGSTTITNTASDTSTRVFSGLGTIHCAQTFADIDVHGRTSPTSITGTLTGLTFTSCTDTLPVIQYTSCALSPTSPFPVVHITATNDQGGTVQITDETIRCSIQGAGTSFCYYTMTSSSNIGAFVNAPSTLTFSGVVLHHVTGSGDLGAICGAQGAFNTTLTHLVQGGTNRTITITTS